MHDNKKAVRFTPQTKVRGFSLTLPNKKLNDIISNECEELFEWIAHWNYDVNGRQFPTMPDAEKKAIRKAMEKVVTLSIVHQMRELDKDHSKYCKTNK